MSIWSLPREIILCGDWNIAHKEIDLRNWRSNQKNSGFLPEEREWLGNFLESGLVDTFRYLNPELQKYSWWSYRFNLRAKNVGWRIDYFLASQDALNMVKDSFIMNDIMGSDHCPVGIILK